MVRIAISGSHSLGKSTFVHDWVHQHPEYIREEEPYRALRDWYAIEFKDGSTRLHNGIQLHYNASRVNRYHDSQDNVIFDRAPVDYIAYSQYTANQGTTDICDAFVDALVPTVRDSLRFLDLLVLFRSVSSGRSQWKTTASALWTWPTATRWMNSSSRSTANSVGRSCRQNRCRCWWSSPDQELIA